MKNRLKNGLFAVLVTLLVGFVCIPENSFVSVSSDLDNQVTVEQPVDVVSVQYAFEVSEISFSEPELSEQYLIASLEESPPVLLQIENSTIENIPIYEGIRDETLSSEYWSETSHFILRLKHSNGIYFT